jgi:hypothetical protein
MCYEEIEIKDTCIKIFLPSCELVNNSNLISSQNNKDVLRIYYKYVFDSIIGLLNDKNIMLHIDKNNFSTLYSMPIDKLLQKDYCLIKTYPVVSLTTKENHFLEENSTILLKNLNKNLKIYIENHNNIIEISTVEEYENILNKYTSFNIVIEGDFSYFRV